MSHDPRFERRLYTIAGAARLAGVHPSTLSAWTKARPAAVSPGPVKSAPPLIAPLPASPADERTISFIGLVEAVVVHQLRQSGIPMQRVRRAVQVLSAEGELENALASKRIFSDGSQVFYDYSGTGRLGSGNLTEVATGQTVMHVVLSRYLERVKFDGLWASELILPVTQRQLLRVVPDVANGEPLFIHGGAPLYAVRSRLVAGESLESVALDFGVPTDEIEEAIGAIWPPALAA